ncbi:hypothetical protein RUND412_002351 [Rhizina undulata]
MLEYFGYKKLKGMYSNGEASSSATSKSPQPVLSKPDEEFLENVLEDNDVKRASVILEGELAEEDEEEEEETSQATGKSKEKKDRWKTLEWREGLKTRWVGLRRTVSFVTEKKKKDKGKGKEVVRDDEEDEITEEQLSPEDAELRAALERLNLAADNGQALSISPGTKILLQTFTQILKDIVRGVPTAYGDLVKFLESSYTQLEQIFVSLPSFLQQIIRTIPEKMHKSVTPELLRTAAAAGPTAAAEAERLASTGALPTLQELMSAPAVVLALLKSIVRMLTTRFPALLGGVNVALSLGLFVLLLIFWYCHKRGKEIRLAEEAEELNRANGEEPSNSATVTQA